MCLYANVSAKDLCVIYATLTYMLYHYIAYIYII